MGKQTVTQRRRPPADGKEEEESKAGPAAAAASKKDDDEIIYKNGKAYKKRRERHDIWTMLSQGAPPEPGGDENKKPKRPRRWYDDLIWPTLLFLTFCLSLWIFHVAPHDTSRGRRMNRFTMDNVASGGFADGGKVKPRGTWGIPGSRRDNEEEEEDDEEK